jgi:hypothetical protein
MKRIIVAGLLAGAVDPVAVLALHAGGALRDPGAGVGLLLVPLAQITIIVAALGARSREVDAGRMPAGYGRALGAGLAAALIAAAIAFAGTWFFTSVVDPSYLGWLLQLQREALTEAVMPPETREAQLATLERAARPLAYAARGAMVTLTVGGLAALVGGAVFRGRPPAPRP